MNLINKISNWTTSRVQKHGAQYKTFAVFGIINYPLSYIYELISFDKHDSLWIRSVSTLLCIILLLKDKWPKKTQQYLPLYWYFTLIICIPTLASYMVLRDNMSLGWLMNFSVGIMILLLLADSLMAIVIEIIGLPLGFVVFIVLGNSIPTVPNLEDLYLSIYMFLCIVILGTIFSRNKEIYSHNLLKAKNDLSEYLNGQVKERTLELEKALAFKTEFLNNMSHEVRTPVQGMCGITEGLVNNWEILDETKKFESMELVAKSCQRLFSLVGNLLDLSKFDAGMMKLDLKQIDLNNSVADMIDECNTLYFREKNTKFKFKPTKEMLVVGDAERITQVLRNLFFNAVKFNFKNSSITAKITKAELQNKKGENAPAIKVSVSDEGIGVPEADFDMIFGIFTQSSATQKRSGGTGLGLPICKQIIESHGGKIWVENNKDKGATFHFIMPVTQPGYAALHERKKRSRKMNLLMIDDEQTCLASIEMMLMNTDYEVIKADTAEDGLQYLKDNVGKVDVVLLDLMMPDMYGYDVLYEIRQNPDFANIPVIMQSGTSDEREIKKCFEIGLTGFVRKPYQKKAVLDVLDRYID